MIEAKGGVIVRCPNCHNDVSEKLKYCTYCGTELTQAVNNSEGSPENTSVRYHSDIEQPAQKKKLSVPVIAGAGVVCLALIAGGIALASKGGKDDAAEDAVAEIEKPSKITVVMKEMVDDTKAVDSVEAYYKEKTDIDLDITKLSSDTYYEDVQKKLSSGEKLDVIEVSAGYYPQWANNGTLWDMTDAWENTTSACKEYINQQYVDQLRIDNRLYGFPSTRGNGTVTYVRKDWLDKAGLATPTNYNEFINMLRKFKGLQGATPSGEAVIPYIVPDIINSDAPYGQYLVEFYQDANPDYYLDASTGKYVDGFTQPAMTAAINRLKSANDEGLINFGDDTKTCRKQVQNGVAGVFNYWAGSYNAKLENELQKKDPNGKLIAIPAIAETSYIERVPSALAITNTAKNPEGIFHYFILYSHDGGEWQTLFTRGVEGEHYGPNEETGEMEIKVAPKSADQGETKKLEKILYDPSLSITQWNDVVSVDSRVTDSLATLDKKVIRESIQPAALVASESELKTLVKLKKDIMFDILHGNITIEEGMKRYNNNELTSEVLARLNGESTADATASN
jgi:putative aldouronate transport system substrate-binding protein